MQTAKALTWTWSRIISRITILLIGLFELFHWGYHLPLLLLRPLSEILTGGVPGLLRFCSLLIFPALALAAGVLAVRGQRLGLAAMLVAIQPLAYVLAIIALMMMGAAGPVRLG